MPSYNTGSETYWDLTQTGFEAAIDGALFRTSAATGSSGTGLIQAFVRVQATGTEDGYNTTHRPLAYDENSSPSFTTSITLASVPKILINGTLYYEFRLDVNQTNNNPLLSLNELKLYKATTGDVQGLITSGTFDAATTPVWDLDDQDLDGVDDINNTLLMNYSLQAGSGKSDLFFYVPVADFGVTPAQEATTYVVLYSSFGETGTLDASDGAAIPTSLYGDYSSNDGFEEWSVSKAFSGTFIHGYKWGDTNGNGVWNVGELGLGGWKIDYTLTYKPANGNVDDVVVVGSVTTSDGTTDYNADGVLDDVGVYYIPIPSSAVNNATYTLVLTEVLPDPSLWMNTYDGDATPNATTTYQFNENNLDAGNIKGDFGQTEVLNFGNFQRFSISGTKYLDANGDGLTAGDVGLGGVTIFIDVDGSGTNNAGDISTTTAGDGTWSLTGLGTNALGKTVYEVLPNGYVQTLGQTGYTLAGVSQDRTGLDFANFDLFDISGTKYLDANGDGLTAGDVGLGGVTIFIDVDGSGTNNAGDISTTTAGDGTWSLTGLGTNALGKTVYEVLPNGYVQTLGQTGYTLAGVSQDRTGLDFANFDLFDISGTKYLDANGDGLTAGDVGLGGVTIFIDVDGSGTNNAGDISTTTAGDGTWSLTGLGTNALGKTVYEVLPNGYVQTLGQTGYTLAGVSQDRTGLDFANFDLFDISGTKYLDANGDGLTAGDVGLGGVTIFIDVDGSGTNNAGDISTTTAGDGTWSLTGLGTNALGKTVYEVLPNGYVQTLGQTGYTLAGVSQDRTGLDFANFQLMNISGYKWNDINGNGQWNGGEGTLATWTIVLDSDNIANNGNEIATTVTNGSGFYQFTNLGPNIDQDGDGKLYVYEKVEDGFQQTYGNFSFDIASGLNIVGHLGVTEQGNFGNHMLGGYTRTPGFWQNKTWLKFWDGDNGNAPKQAGDTGFPGLTDLLIVGHTDGSKDSNGSGGLPNAADKGLLIGDWNLNGINDNYGLDGIPDNSDDYQEDTIFIGYADALSLIKASDNELNGNKGNSTLVLGRDVVATWLNYLAGANVGSDTGPGSLTPQHFVNDAVDWLQQFASNQNGPGGLGAAATSAVFEINDPKVGASSPSWQTAQPGIDHSASVIHSELDYYNNTGAIYDPSDPSMIFHFSLHAP